MTKKTILSLAAALAVAALPATAGEWHAGATNLCSDCHTMHYSMQHDFVSANAPSTSPVTGGNWLTVNNGPNEFLLKAPANQLCLQCHDNQTFAPDVYGANANGYVRSGGAINDANSGTGYETWKGHTLGTPAATNPPGVVGTWYAAANPNGLECISCHAQHGQAAAYRNLGAYSLPNASAIRPTYVIGSTNDTTKDVWVNVPAGYVGGTGVAATFSPYYDNANISYNRNDKPVTLNGVAQTTSNTMDAFCGECHGNFHGGVNDTNIAGTPGTLDGFLRHPTSGVTIGASTFGGHSSLAQFAGTGTNTTTTRVKVYSSVGATGGYTDASPGCVTCHKAHGNQNPFGLIFLNRNAATVTEEGGYKTGETVNYTNGYKNLCGQCHSQASAM